MAWHTIPKPTPAEKQFRSQITTRYGSVTFYGSIAFLLAIWLAYVLLPRASFSRKRLITYTHKRPSRAVSLPLPWIVATFIIGIAYVTLAETQQEFVFLAKRLGRVPVALFPVTYFLALRPTPLPRVFYLQLIPLHKWLSRLIVLSLLVHAIVYLAVYVHLSKLAKLTEWSNISGIVAFFLFVLIALTSLKFVRRRFYNLFYSTHYTVSWITLPMIWYHSNTSTRYMLMAAALLLAQAAYRVYISAHMKLPVQYVSPTLFFISIPRSRLPKSLQSYFAPGSHLRISNPLYHPSTWFQSSHPYTIASLPQDPNVTLVVRKTHYPIKLRNLYAVTGPYGSIPPSFFQDVNSGLVNRALFIAGGSGIAFCAPIIRHMRNLNIPVKFLWAIRDAQEVTVLETLGLLDAALTDGQVEVYVTGTGLTAEPMAPSPTWYTPNEDEGFNIDINDDCCGGEFQPLVDNSKKVKYTTEVTQMSDYSRIMFNSRPVLNLRIKSWLYGVPVDNNSCCCLDQLMTIGDDADTSGRWVLASGAEALTRESENWATGNGFSFFKDDFSL